MGTQQKKKTHIKSTNPKVYELLEILDKEYELSKCRVADSKSNTNKHLPHIKQKPLDKR